MFMISLHPRQTEIALLCSRHSESFQSLPCIPRMNRLRSGSQRSRPRTPYTVVPLSSSQMTLQQQRLVLLSETEELWSSLHIASPLQKWKRLHVDDSDSNADPVSNTVYLKLKALVYFFFCFCQKATTVQEVHKYLGALLDTLAVGMTNGNFLQSCIKSSRDISLPNRTRL